MKNQMQGTVHGNPAESEKTTFDFEKNWNAPKLELNILAGFF